MERVSPQKIKNFLGYIPAIDSMRGYLSLLIFFMHMHESFIPKGLRKAHDSVEVARLFVIWFFVVSGYLITRILVNSPLTGESLKIFWLRRSLRIFPIFYIVIFAVLFIQPDMSLLWTALYLSNYATNLTGSIHPLMHTWSLSVEEHFYLLWPILLYFFPKKPKEVALGMLALSLAAAILTPVVFPKDIAKAFLKHASHVHFLPIAFGCYIAAANVKFTKLRWTLIGSFGFLLGLVYCAANPSPFTGAYNNLLKTLSLHLGAIGLFILVMNLGERSTGWLRAALEWKPMVTFGKMTYGFYLIHYVVFYSLGVLHERRMENAGNWQILFLAVFLTFSLTTFSYYFIESPISNLKRYFRYNKSESDKTPFAFIPKPQLSLQPGKYALNEKQEIPEAAIHPELDEKPRVVEQ